MTRTTTTGVVTPVLFCDFNTPKRDGLHWCLCGSWNVEIDQRVKFGCENDGVMAYGVVRARTDRLAGVEFQSWETNG